MASPTNEQGKKKGRLGRLFGSKKDETRLPTSAQNDDHPVSSSSNIADSAYASSGDERKLSNNISRPDVVPFENKGQISGVNEDRKLAVDKSTGDVMDKDTGEVVSTVTTTTTTTTTMTSPASNKNMMKRSPSMPVINNSEKQKQEAAAQLKLQKKTKSTEDASIDKKKTPDDKKAKPVEPEVPEVAY